MHKIIVANYKMNGDKKFYQSVQKVFNKLKLQDTKIILCPPFVYLPFFKLKNKNIELGAQDISNCVDDKSTGQISPNMLAEFCAKYVIIGHSERRALGEDLFVLQNKISTALNNDIQPIICVDEKTNLESEVKYLLNNQKSFVPIFAFEPSWAIDSGKVAKASEIDDVVEKIKNICKSMSVKCKVLYGGGVDTKTYQEIKKAKVDGCLLGGTSLNNDEMIALIKEVDNE